MRKSHTIKLLAYKSRRPILSEASLRPVHDVLAYRGDLECASIDLGTYPGFQLTLCQRHG
jgi:hypothetical protein